MLHATNDWLRWDEEDALIMARILGPDLASKGWARRQDSILKAASKTRILMDDPAAQLLAHAKRERIALKQMRHLTDVHPLGYTNRQDLLSKLWAHQRVALHYMRRRPAYLLADRPGLGKTPVAILWTRERADDRVLVVTPNSAKEQWAREIKRWGRITATVVEGTIKEQSKILRGDGWVVTHWESLVHARKAILQRPWSAVILDEAQAIRNRKAQRSKTAFSIETAWRLALTGHPFFNSPDELWSILRFLYPEEYTSFWRFFGMHVNALPRAFGGYDVMGVRNPKLLRWEIAPFSLRRSKTQVFPSLPPIARTPRQLALEPGSRREYERLKREFFVELRGHGEAVRVLAIPSVLARVTRLRQYLIDPGLLGSKQPSIKYPMVQELLEELDGPPVIFTMFRQAAVRLRTFLGEKRIGLITGGMKKGESARMQAAFHAGQLRALIVVTQAGGTALNLGRYGYVILLDLPWTPADLEQCEGRVDRPVEGTGQMVATTSYPLIITDTYEEKQIELLENKRSMFNEVFSPRELEALFTA